MALVRLDRDPARALAALTTAARDATDLEALAFLAIEQHRLGKHGAAAESLVGFRRLVQEVGGDAGLAALQREVEALLGPLPGERGGDAGFPADPFAPPAR
jgi:hypothetical protein